MELKTTVVSRQMLLRIPPTPRKSVLLLFLQQLLPLLLIQILRLILGLFLLLLRKEKCTKLDSPAAWESGFVVGGGGGEVLLEADVVGLMEGMGGEVDGLGGGI